MTYTTYPTSPEAEEQISGRSVLLIDDEAALDLLSAEDCVSALEGAYRAEAQGAAANTSKASIHVPTADPEAWHQYVSLEGAVRDLGVVAVRIRSNIHWTRVVDGKKRSDCYAGTPDKFGGLVLLFSSVDGALMAIMNDGHIQHMRVGATSALSAKFMARSDARTLGIIGSSGMAMAHAWTLPVVRPIELIKVYSPSREHRETFARQVTADVGVETVAMDDPREVVRGSDIVSACTNSHQPVLEGAWLEAGMHVTVVNEHEADDDALRRIDRYALYRSPATEHCFTTPPEWRPASLGGISADAPRREEQLVGAGDIVPLVDIVLGKEAGRTRREEITCGASEGTGVQFAALAHLLYARARENGRGQELPLGSFLQDIRS